MEATSPDKENCDIMSSDSEKHKMQLVEYQEITKVPKKRKQSNHTNDKKAQYLLVKIWQLVKNQATMPLPICFRN